MFSVLIAIIGTGMENIMLAVDIFAIPTYARLVRSSVLVIKETEFVEAAQAIGGSINIQLRPKHPTMITDAETARSTSL